MIRAIIIDDSKKDRTDLRQLLEAEHYDIEIIGQFDNAEKGLRGIKELSPQLVFLDVEMPPGMDGIKMLAEIPKAERNFDVIFTTAHNRFAVQAFRMACLDFLEKPISPTELSEALAKHRAETDNKLRLAKYEVLVEHLKDIPLGRKPMNLPLGKGKGMRCVRMDDILYMAAPGGDGSSGTSGKYTTFFFTDGSRILVSHLLRDWERKLSPYGALRINRSNIINMKYVHAYTSDRCAVLKSGNVLSPELTVSDKYRAGFEGRFLD